MQRTDGVSGTSKMYYLHTDHLGSVVSVTDAAGNLTPKPISTNPTVSQRYYAYGRERVGSVANLPTDYTFTGQKQDSTGLMYFNARYFDPQIGAFISPDTLIPDPTDLYSYNRYMAFRGNPMKYTDPTGHFIETIWDAANIGIGVASLGYNLYNGNWSDAAWDAGGLAIDVAATALPFIPGGAATAIKAGRAVNVTADLAGVVNKVDNVVDAAKTAERVDDAVDLGKQGTPNIVYRALAKGEDSTIGLSARSPNAGNTPLSHVANKKNSQWISTTANPAVAFNKYDKGHGVVKIDLTKVNTEIVDLRNGIPNGGRFSNYAKSDMEILIKNFVSADAIERIK